MKAHTSPPQEWSSIHPPFRVPEWAPLGKPVIPAAELSRHVLAIGQTGVGKTKSIIGPLLRAAYYYPYPEDYALYAEKARATAVDSDPIDELHPSALVIDPKAELVEQIAALQYHTASPREVIEYGSSERQQVIWYFENTDVRAMRSMEVADEILAQSIYLEREKQATDPYWGRRAESLLRLTIEIDHDLYKTGGLERLKSFWHAVSQAVVAMAADESYLRQALSEQPLHYCRDCYLRPIATLYNLSATFHRDSGRGDPILDGYLSACQEFGIPYGKQYEIMALRLLSEVTYGCIISVINNVLDELASDELAQYISLNPFEAPQHLLSVANIVDNGHFLIYSPGAQFGLANALGRMLKTKFFAYALSRRNLIRPFFYIADEAQRFVSGDPISGEQSFLDRCRAFRCISILASQSIASLRFALAATDNGPESGALGAASLNSVLQNIGNAFYFRTVDNETTQTLTHMFPNAPVTGKPHIISVRPPSSLVPGESYYLFADGRVGRGHVLFQPTPNVSQQIRRDLLSVLAARVQSGSAKGEGELGKA